MGIMKKKISIIGAGWVGLPLAIDLKNKGHEVSATTTTPSKIETLTKNGIVGYLLTIDGVGSLQGHPILDADILIITLPFKRSFTVPTVYLDQFKSILEAIPTTHSPWVIMTTSTSIYPDRSGVMTEETPILPTNAREQALLDTETLVRSYSPSSIVRLGGLTGPNRALGKFLSGKRDIKDATTNLIHLDDVILIISKMIEKNATNITLNGVSDHHPLKSTLYIDVSKKAGLPPPTFASSPPIEKIVSNHLLKSVLGITLTYPDPLKMTEAGK